MLYDFEKNKDSFTITKYLSKNDRYIGRLIFSTFYFKILYFAKHGEIIDYFYLTDNDKSFIEKKLNSMSYGEIFDYFFEKGHYTKEVDLKNG